VGADLALANQYFQPDRGHALAKVTLSAPPAKRFTPTHLALFNPCSPSSFDDTGVQASGATATCTLSGNTVGSAAVTAPGTGYVLFNSDRTKAAGDNQYFYPVSFSGGGGAGATGTVYIDGPSGGVIDLVIDNHGSGYTSPPTITIGTLGYPAAAAYNYSDNNMIIPITDTTYIVRINSGSAPVGSYASGYSDVHKTLTGTTTVTGTMFLAPGLGAGISLQERVRICNDLGRDYWHQSGILESDACLAAVGAYIAANLDAGLKCYAENANEVWNTGPPFPDTPRARILANHENYKYSISGGHDGYQIGTEAQYHALVSHNQHTILQQAFTAAGRANDFFAVIGSGLGQPGFTSDVFATLKRYNLNYTSPVFFPNPVHLAIANYDNNTTVAGAYYTPGDAPAPIGASYLRLSAKGLVDLDVLHNFHQIGWKGLVDLHISSAADSDFDVVIVGYEGGLSGMRPGFFSPGETAQDVTDMSHEAFRHSWAFHAERCRLQKRTADGWTAVCIYTYGSGDVGLDGGNWIVVTSPESPLGSGDPSEDRNPHDLRNAYSQVGGAHLAYVSDIPTPTGTLSLIGPSTGITGVPSASFAVTGTDLSGSDTVTAHCTGGSFSGSPMSFSSGTSANTFTFAPTSDGAHSITITDSLGATILNSPIIYTSSTPTPTPTVTQYVASPMRGRHRRRSI
jgi:hypothetical protein